MAVPLIMLLLETLRLPLVLSWEPHALAHPAVRLSMFNVFYLVIIVYAAETWNILLLSADSSAPAQTPMTIWRYSLDKIESPT